MNNVLHRRNAWKSKWARQLEKVQMTLYFTSTCNCATDSYLWLKLFKINFLSNPFLNQKYISTSCRQFFPFLFLEGESGIRHCIWAHFIKTIELGAVPSVEHILPCSFDDIISQKHEIPNNKKKRYLTELFQAWVNLYIIRTSAQYIAEWVISILE